MRGRVNTPFVFLLIGILTVIPLSLGAYWYFFIRLSPTELIARGEAAAAEGNWSRAAEQYYRALRARDNDPALLVKFGDALQKVEVSTVYDATSTLQQAIASYHKASNLDPANVAVFEKLMGLYLTLGRDLRDSSAWDQMLQRSQLSLAANPAFTAARKYRGIAQVQRTLLIDVGVEDRKAARADLEAALAATPDDQDVAVHLAIHFLAEARLQDKPGGQAGLAAEMRKLAVKTSADALGRAAQDPLRQVDHVSILFEAGQTADAMRLLAAVEAALLAKPEPVRSVIDTVNLLLALGKRSGADAASGRERAQALLRAAGKAHPGDTRVSLLLAQSLSSLTPPTEASEIFDRVGGAPYKGTSLEVLQQRSYRANANAAAVMILLVQAETAPDAASRETHLKKAETIVRQLETDSPKSAMAMVLGGRLALLRKSYGEAVVKLDKASAAYNDADPEVLLLSAKARAELGERGAAIDRLNRLVSIRPDFVPARLELARLHIQLRQNDEAGRQLEAVLRADPKDPRALLLKAILLSQTGQAEQSVRVLRQIEETGSAEIAQAMAQVYATTDQKQEAVRILRARMEQDPKDLRSLAMLLRLGLPVEQGRAMLAAAVKAGASGGAVTLLESQLTPGGVDQSKTLEAIIDQGSDPFQKALERYGLYRRTGRKDEALASLAEAAKLNPDHAQVVEAQFTEALLVKDWASAEAMVARASKLDLDLAQGAFFQGRLEATRGRLEQAESLLNRALTARPIFSEGWRLLGDVQRSKGDLAGAARAYGRAIEQRPDNVVAMRELAGVQSAQGQRTAALATLRNAHRLAPDDVSLTAAYLAYEGQFGDAELAVRIHRQLAKSRPDDALNRRSLALLLARLGRTDEAVQAADELAKALPTSANVAVAASVRALLGRGPEGRKILEAHLASVGDKATAEDHLYLARYVLSIGQGDDAEAAYQRAIKLEDPKTRPATRELADVYFDRGQAAKAVTLYQQLLETEPKDKSIAHRSVEALSRAGRFDEAEKLLARTTADHGADGGSALLEALIAAGRKDRAGALSALGRAVQLDPDRAVIYFERAGILALDPEGETAAIADLRKAIELDPDMGRARRALASIHARRDEVDDATRELTLLLERTPQDGAARALLADLYLRTRQFSPLRRLVEEAVKLAPADPAWPRVAASAARLEGRNEVAEQRLREVLRLAPGAPAVAELAEFLISAKKAPAAVELLRQESKLVSGNAGLLTLQARALAASGAAEKASASFAQALEACASAPQLSAVANAMAESLGRDRAAAALEAQGAGAKRFMADLALAGLEMGRGQYAPALARLKKIEPGAPATGVDRDFFDRLLATAYHQAKDHENAQAAYRRILQKNADDPSTLNNLAYLLSEDLGKPAEALPLARRAVQLVPGNAQFLDTLGRVQWRVGQVDDAYNTLRRSVARAPLPANHLHLAEVILSRGDRPEALKLLETSQRLAQQGGDERTAEAAAKRIKELGAKDKP